MFERAFRGVGRLAAAAVFLHLPAAAPAQELTWTFGEITIRAAGRSGNAQAFLELRWKDGRGPARLPLEHTAEIKEAWAPAPNRIVVWGTLASRGDVFTLIQTQTGRVEDTFWGYDASVSPDRKTVAYKFRTPPSAGPVRFSPALLAYDLTAPVAANRAPGASSAQPDERGVVLYPERHRREQRYWILLPEGEPGRDFVSPIAWRRDSRTIAVVEHTEPDTDEQLVMIDVSRGLRQPVVAVVPVWRSDFLSQRYGNAVPSEYAKAYVAFKDLRFTEDGRSVTLTSWEGGPFAGRSITVPVPGTR